MVITFESWFATSIHCSVGSSVKLRGVFPPQFDRTIGVSFPVPGFALNAYRKSSSRFAKYTNRPSRVITVSHPRVGPL